MRLALFLMAMPLVALSTAGCAGDSAEGAPTDALAADGEQATGERMGRAGASLAGPGNATAPPIDVAWDGAIDPGFCAPAGPNSCIGSSLPIGSGLEDALFVRADPAAWTGTLTLAWTPSSPATEELQFGLTFYESCGAGCYQSDGPGHVVSGPSPLVLDADRFEAPAASEGLWIWVRQVRLTPDPVYGYANVGQEFRADGRLEPSWPSDA